MLEIIIAFGLGFILRPYIIRVVKWIVSEPCTLTKMLSFLMTLAIITITLVVVGFAGIS